MVKIISIMTEYINKEDILEETGKTIFKVKPECKSLDKVIPTVSEDIKRHLQDGHGRTMVITIKTNKGQMKIVTKGSLKGRY